MQPIAIWKLLLLSPVLFLLPGFALVWYVRDRYDANLIASEIIALSLALSLLITSLVGLIFAELSIYTLTRVVAAVLLISVLLGVAWYLRRRRGVGPRTRGERTWWFTAGFIALIILASIMFIGRFEAILTEADVSPYLIRGVNIADHGRIFLENKTMADLTDAESNLLYGTRSSAGEAEYVSGYLIRNRASGQVSTRYFPYYSVLLAMSYRLIGLKGTLTVFNPYLAILALVFIVLTVRRLFGELTALAAGLILSLSPLMIWFARYLIPEMLTLLLVFLGLYCLYHYYPRGDAHWGILAAVSLGGTLTARYDLYAILIPLAAYMVVCLFASLIKRERVSYLLWFVVPLTVVTLHAWISERAFNGRYFSEVSTIMPRFIRYNTGLIMAFAAAVVFLASIPLLFSPVRRAVASAFRFVKPYWRPALAIILVLLCIFAYVVRPHISNKTAKLYGHTMSIRTEKNFSRMSWYFTHLGLILFILGLALFVLFGLSLKSTALFLVCGFFTLLYFYNPACNPLHVWFLRRFIYAVIPFMVIMIAYALTRLPGLLPWKKIAGSASVVALIVILVFSGVYTAKIYPLIQYEGALDGAQGLAVRLGGRKTVTIFYDTYARTYFPELLRYVYHLNTLPLNGETGDPKTFDSLVHKLKAEGNRVYLAGTAAALPPAAADLAARPVDSLPVSLRLLRQEYDRRPSTVVDFMFTVYIYALQEPQETSSIDIGNADSQYVEDGFYDPQAVDKIGARWASGSAGFLMPNLQARGHLLLNMVLSLGSRPTDKPVPVNVYCQGAKIGTVDVSGSDFNSYSLTFDKSSLPDGNAKNLEFRIETPTWSPAQSGKSKDARSLGVAVDRVVLAPAP